MPISLTPLSATVAVIPLVLGMIYFLRTGIAEYGVFKATTKTEDRQGFYRRWTFRSFLIFSVVTIGLLTVFGRIDALFILPDEFVPLAEQLATVFADENEVLDPNFVWIILFAMAASAILSPSLITYLSRGKAEAFIAGDVLPLLPRNREEKSWAAAISANAGLGEELFFRLLLPLLFTYVFGNVLLAFVAAAIVFGVIHSYQGWVGVLATTVLGALLMLIYLGTENLWVVIAVHAAIDLNGLILQPYLKLLVERHLT